MLLEPRPFPIVDGSGKERVYILSKFPAVQGREIVAKYPMSNLPKLGDYNVSEETMFKLMKFVAVEIDGRQLCLETRDLINNHVTDWETLAKIEMAMLDINTSFFRNGTAFAFLENAVQRVLASISEISIRSSAPSSPTEKPPSTNSGPSTL